MITKENLNYAVRNLLNRKVRSFLTIMSIFVGITTIFIFISFGWGLYHYIDELSLQMGINKLVVQARGMGAPGLDNSFKLTDKDLETLRKTRGIDQAAGFAVGVSQVRQGKKLSYQALAGMPTDKKEDFDLMMEFFTVKIAQGRNLAKGDEDKTVLGNLYLQADKIFPKTYRLGDKINVNGRDLKIIGFFEAIGNPSDDGNIYVTPDTFLKLTGKDSINYGMMIGKVGNVDEIKDVLARVEKRIRVGRGLEIGKEDFFVSTSEDMIASFKTVLNIVIGFIILIAAISVIVSMINTSNTMFTSILERTREIGVLKAIGATNSEIRNIFLLESGFLGFTAGIVGVLLGFVLSYLGGIILKSLGWGFLQPYFPAELFITLILFATIVGTVSGYIPAFNASKKNPVDSLRYE